MASILLNRIVCHSFQFALPFSCRRERRNRASVAATRNNGQITEFIDSVAGQTVDYTYDSLNRLIAASTTGSQWGLSFSYDGFGNRLSQTVTKGSAPASSLAINPATNRISSTGYVYDANGNLTTMPSGTSSLTLSYDVENRLAQASTTSMTNRFGYDLDNRQVYTNTLGSTVESIIFYGAFGERLKEYTLQWGNYQAIHWNLYFDGKLIWQDYKITPPANGGIPGFQDRLGSRMAYFLAYYPFGEGQVPGRDFATYLSTPFGIDYAHNRYYASNLGRFTTPDPYGGSANLGDSQSWNRYAYVNNDPVNRNDPSGLDYYYYGPRAGNDFFDWEWLCRFFGNCSGGNPGGRGEGPTVGPGGPRGVDPYTEPSQTVPANNTVSSSPCNSAGNALSPQQYQAVGYAARASWLYGPEVGVWSNAGALAMFKRGLPLDAQVLYGGSPAYANYAYGVYAAAAGLPLSVAFAGANAYASVFSSYERKPPYDENYKSTPAENIQNITKGYNDQKNGTLCSIPNQ